MGTRTHRRGQGHAGHQAQHCLSGLQPMFRLRRVSPKQPRAPAWGLSRAWVCKCLASGLSWLLRASATATPCAGMPGDVGLCTLCPGSRALSPSGCSASPILRPGRSCSAMLRGDTGLVNRCPTCPGQPGAGDATVAANSPAGCQPRGRLLEVQPGLPPHLPLPGQR